MSNEKDEQWLERWREYRAKGRVRGIAIPAVSFLVLYAVLMAVMSLVFGFSDPLSGSLIEGQFARAGVVAVLYVLGATAFGWINWTVAERRYQRLTQHGSK